MTAQRDRGSFAWRRRQIYSTSLLGRDETLSRSRYDDNGLIPGVLVLVSTDDFTWVVFCVDVGSPMGDGGGGGGCWKGEYSFAGGLGAASPGIVAAKRRKSEILSL